MKKIFAVVALALMTLTVSAQDESKTTFKAGVGLSSVVGSDTEADKSIFSYKVGISYDLGISENFSIIPGLDYVNKGFKEDGINGNINMSYLQIPVFAAYKIPVSDNMKLAVKAGPYVSYGIFGSDIKFKNGATINVFDSDMFDRFDVGAIAGISLDINQYMVGLEYSRGLKKLDSDVKAYHQAFGLVFGYKF